VRTLGNGEYLIIVDLLFFPPAQSSVTLGKTPFGCIGVRVAKTIGVSDGGGLIRNSRGQVNEPAAFRKKARWVDYSGPITRNAVEGLTLMDHPINPGHPAVFHVRNDGWMGACLTYSAPLVIRPGRGLRLRYGLYVHAGLPDLPAIEEVWKRFKSLKLPELRPGK